MKLLIFFVFFNIFAADGASDDPELQRAIMMSLGGGSEIVDLDLPIDYELRAQLISAGMDQADVDVMLLTGRGGDALIVQGDAYDEELQRNATSYEQGKIDALITEVSNCEFNLSEFIDAHKDMVLDLNGKLREKEQAYELLKRDHSNDLKQAQRLFSEAFDGDSLNVEKIENPNLKEKIVRGNALILETEIELEGLNRELADYTHELLAKEASVASAQEKVNQLFE